MTYPGCHECHLGLQPDFQHRQVRRHQGMLRERRVVRLRRRGCKSDDDRSCYNENAMEHVITPECL